MNLKNKKVAVVGLGNSGINAAILLADIGAHVWATDSKDGPAIKESVRAFKEKNIKFELGGHTKDFIKDSILVVVSPGVEGSSLPVKWAVELGIPIISEMELGFRFCKGKVIAVTGTNGKSTVTTLIGEILKGGGLDTVVCGNIGNSLCGEIHKIKNDTWVVLEVSSFQLERIETFKPCISIILNITDDHLDRYKYFDDYFKEKLKVFVNQDRDDILILNYDAPNLRTLEGMAHSKVLFYSKAYDPSLSSSAAYTKNGRLLCLAGGMERDICAINDIMLKGAHNLENVLVSVLTGTLAGVGSDSIRTTVRKFKGLSHRVELVDIIDGVEYIDDSKGTTVDSTRRALESTDKRIILIAGGKDKNSDYGAIRELVKKKVAFLVLIGEASAKIKKILSDVVETHEAASMPEAVRLAHGLAGKDSAVLLSPMCSSFDMFKDYKQRGEVFKDAVRALKDVHKNKAGIAR